MTATLFKDWVENCAVPELKAYSSSENIEFKMLLLIDNAPGHPIFSDDISENIKVVFMPPNTTSILQPMDQGVISNFKCYYLRRTFSQLLHASDGHNKPSMKEFWRNYNILMAIENINQSWMEVKKSCMNGVWRQIWPDCVPNNIPEINDINSICQEIAERASTAEVDGMEEDDINELLMSHEEFLNNEDLFSIDVEHALEDEILTPDNIAEEKHLKVTQISEAMQLISKAMDIFTDNDPDENRSSKVLNAVTDAIDCYREIYLQKKSVKVQRKITGFFKKDGQLSNQNPDVTIALE